MTNNSLERTEKIARDYAQCEQDTWARVKQEHDRAMFVRDVEDLVDYGLFALSVWFRHAVQWHEFVSQDAKRYNKQFHEKLKTIEGLATKATIGTIELINHVKKGGYEIAKEDELRQLAEDVLGAARQPQDQFQDRAFARFRQASLKEYQSGSVEEIEHWGQ